MRYGHQPLSELLALEMSDLYALTDEICALVEAENGTIKREDD